MKNRYFNWLCDRVSTDETKENYSNLFSLLFNIPFEPTLALDENRLVDGIDMRDIFAYFKHIPKTRLAPLYEWDECSMLEMIVGLANRMEESIMGNIRYGDRTGQWFWNMLDSLGISEYDNEHFDENEIREIIDIFNNRCYEYDGRGGLFTLNHPDKDMRSQEIWYQMQAYLLEQYNE